MRIVAGGDGRPTPHELTPLTVTDAVPNQLTFQYIVVIDPVPVMVPHPEGASVHWYERAPGIAGIFKVV
jgi:hypothetical protein